MSLPSTQEDEVFVREMVAIGDPLVACMRSGMHRRLGLPMSESARITMDRDDIKRAIAEARSKKKFSQPIEFTNRSIAEDLERVFDQAFAAEDWKACIWAKEAQTKTLGLLVNKVEITKKLDIEEMSTEQLERIVRDHQRLIIEGESRVIDVEHESGGEGGEGTSGPSEG